MQQTANPKTIRNWSGQQLRQTMLQAQSSNKFESTEGPHTSVAGGTQRDVLSGKFNVLSSADQLYLKGGENVLAGLALFDLEWANIRAGQAWAEKNHGQDSMAARLCDAYPGAGAFVLDLRLNPTDFIRWLKSGLNAAREIGDRRGEGNRRFNMSLILNKLDQRAKAIENAKAALQIFEEIESPHAEQVRTQLQKWQA